MIDKITFTSVINSMENQYDLDAERASLIGEIYGADINPVDNSQLTSAIEKLLATEFNKEQMGDIRFFCYDQNFGRNVNLNSHDLWRLLMEYPTVEGGDDWISSSTLNN